MCREASGNWSVDFDSGKVCSVVSGMSLKILFEVIKHIEWKPKYGKFFKHRKWFLFHIEILHVLMDFVNFCTLSIFLWVRREFQLCESDSERLIEGNNCGILLCVSWILLKSLCLFHYKFFRLFFLFWGCSMSELSGNSFKHNYFCVRCPKCVCLYFCFFF